MLKRCVYGILLATFACSPKSLEDAAVGKVVVYRNGVAYYERTAQVQSDELTLAVPSEKVNDLLKSLVVRDAANGKALPVSFPSYQQNKNTVNMKIKLPDNATREVVLTYLAEAPAWKPSYRINIDSEGKVKLQGWAVVDNTSGEDWKDVLVGVGSSSALSFRYDLWRIREVERATLSEQTTYAVAPPTATSAHTNGKQRQVLGSLSNMEINAEVGAAPGSVGDEIGVSFAGSSSLEGSYTVDGVNTTGLTYGTVGGSTGSEFLVRNGAGSSSIDTEALAKERARQKKVAAEQAARRAKNKRRVEDLAQRLKSERGNIQIWGYAANSGEEGQAAAVANTLRNQLINEGVAPAQIEVKTDVAKDGQPIGVQVVAEGNEPDATEMPDTPVGESNFRSQTPVSVMAGSSAMVSVINSDTEGEIVYLYDAESARGNGRFAFKAIRLKNPTGSTLESGPITVYGESTFVGEGLSDPIPPNATSIIPFALDRQIVADGKDEYRDEIVGFRKLHRAQMHCDMARVRKTNLTLTNRQKQKQRVYVRRTITDGWELKSSPKEFEKLGPIHFFAVDLNGEEEKTITIEESTPIQRTLDLRIPAELEMIRMYLASQGSESKFSKDVAALLATHKEIQGHYESIRTIEDQLVDYRVRLDELHAQLVTLKAVRSSGDLMRHLRDKMKDTSERVQKATLKLVEHREKVTMARISFQEQVAELTYSGGKTLAKSDN